LQLYIKIIFLLFSCMTITLWNAQQYLTGTISWAEVSLFWDVILMTDEINLFFTQYKLQAWVLTQANTVFGTSFTKDTKIGLVYKKEGLKTYLYLRFEVPSTSWEKLVFQADISRFAFAPNHIKVLHDLMHDTIEKQSLNAAYQRMVALKLAMYRVAEVVGRLT
jgi:hypothetical protein